jgi:glycosyltransferase involved in cell wall biosynthesis
MDQIDKDLAEYKDVFTKPNPLVSVIIPTYNAGEMLVNYSLKSVLDQTYKNLEIIVINDGSIDDTVERVSKIRDSRIVFETIEHQENTNWYATSVKVINHGLKLCTGDYVAHLDDDDWFLPEKIQTIIDLNKTARAEIVHHPFLIHYEDFEIYKRVYMESPQCSGGNVTTSSLFYHGWFAQVPFGGDDPQLLQLPGDWDKARKILEFGGKPARCPEMLLLKNGYRHCDPLRNRVYRPQLEPPPYKSIKWSDENA